MKAGEYGMYNEIWSHHVTSWTSTLKFFFTPFVLYSSSSWWKNGWIDTSLVGRIHCFIYLFYHFTERKSGWPMAELWGFSDGIPDLPGIRIRDTKRGRDHFSIRNRYGGLERLNNGVGAKAIAQDLLGIYRSYKVHSKRIYGYYNISSNMKLNQLGVSYLSGEHFFNFIFACSVFVYSFNNQASFYRCLWNKDSVSWPFILSRDLFYW